MLLSFLFLQSSVAAALCVQTLGSEIPASHSLLDCTLFSSLLQWPGTLLLEISAGHCNQKSSRTSSSNRAEKQNEGKRLAMTVSWCLLAMDQGFLQAKHQSRVLSCNMRGYRGARGYSSFLPSFLGIPVS